MKVEKKKKWGLSEEAAKRKAEYNIQYAKDHKKRIPFDVQKEFYDNILKPAALAAGEPVNTYIKNAIMMRMEMEGIKLKRPLQVGTMYADPEGVWKITKIEGDDITVKQMKEGADYGISYSVPVDEVTPYL